MSPALRRNLASSASVSSKRFMVRRSSLGGQGKTGHLSTLQNRPFPVSGIEAS
jgi:hypothetical protein